MHYIQIFADLKYIIRHETYVSIVHIHLIIDKLHAMLILVSTRSHKHFFFVDTNIELRDYLVMAIRFAY